MKVGDKRLQLLEHLKLNKINKCTWPRTNLIEKQFNQFQVSVDSEIEVFNTDEFALNIRLNLDIIPILFTTLKEVCKIVHGN